jgi:hypothetical protein
MHSRELWFRWCGVDGVLVIAPTDCSWITCNLCADGVEKQKKKEGAGYEAGTGITAIRW